MNIESVAPEPGPKRKPTRSLLWKAASKVWAWISSRRTSRAIAANKTAVIALSSSVAAAGVGVHATVVADHAQHGVQDLAARTYALEADMVTTTAQLSQIRTDVRALDRKSAAALHALRVKLNAAGIAMDRLAAQIAAIPPAPSLAPLARRVSKLAATTSETAKLALEATSAAAEQHDPEARFQAQLAADAAGEAGRAAVDAQKTADAAIVKVDALTPFPRIVDFVPFTTTVIALPMSKTVSVDLPKGQYKATLTASLDGASNVSWYARLTADGHTDLHDSTGPGTVQVELDLASNGGVTPFVFGFDALGGTGPLSVTGFLTLERL